MFYTVEKIADNTYRFNENGRANCYLVVGEDQALMIDGCYGIKEISDISQASVI